jgi:RNA polymerase sigma factor (sigma-70 family)
MPINSILRHVRRAALLRDADGQLLERFLASRDEAAFEALVRHHGRMVLGVCRRVLGNHHDAEDAFQATFLVLVRKAASVRRRAAVGSWLYGVAYRTALEAKGRLARRRVRERQVRDMLQPTAEPEEALRELLPVLDRELSRLPEHYRSAVVLCDLEGKTRGEAARLLGVPESTLSGRLTTARRLLAKRLARYGPAFAGGALAAALAQGAASACVPAPLIVSTTRAATLVAAGNPAAAGKAAVLAEGVLKTMFVTKLRMTVGVALVAVALGAAGLVYEAGGGSGTAQAAGPEGKPPTESLSPSANGKQEDGNLKETVLALEKRIYEAYKAQDRAAFGSLLADDFEGVNLRGYPFDKAGELKYVANFCATEYELKDARVILLTPKSALVTYEVHYKVRPTGAQNIIENITSHRTAAWAQRNGKWWRVYVEDRVAQQEGINGSEDVLGVSRVR